MGALRTDDARRGHLVSCPACDASNPVNALACWHCEQALPKNDPFDEPAPPEPSMQIDDDSPNLSERPSFFPVLRDEASEPAANDAPTWDSESPEPAESFRDVATRTAPDGAAAAKRWVIVATAIAVAAALAWFLGSDPEPPRAQEPPPTRVSKPAEAVVAAPVTTPAPPPAPAVEAAPPAPTPTAAAEPEPPARAAPQAATPQATKPAPRRVAPRAPADAEPPPLKPVQAPCTPNVAALGLCSPR